MNESEQQRGLYRQRRYRGFGDGVPEQADWKGGHSPPDNPACLINNIVYTMRIYDIINYLYNGKHCTLTATRKGGVSQNG